MWHSVHKLEDLGNNLLCDPLPFGARWNKLNGTEIKSAIKFLVYFSGARKQRSSKKVLKVKRNYVMDFKKLFQFRLKSLMKLSQFSSFWMPASGIMPNNLYKSLQIIIFIFTLIFCLIFIHIIIITFFIHLSHLLHRGVGRILFSGGGGGGKNLFII